MGGENYFQKKIGAPGENFFQKNSGGELSHVQKTPPADKYGVLPYYTTYNTSSKQYTTCPAKNDPAGYLVFQLLAYVL